MGHSQAAHDDVPHPIDPEHDVDGKKTASWLFWWSLAFAASIWLSFLFFGLLTDDELIRKVDQAPTTQVDQLRELEKTELAGAGSRKSIDEAIKAYVGK